MGARRGDLRGMVMPLISIDEYSAKTSGDEEIIVVGFYCREELVAYDLDDFIDKSIVDILDSEVSPNPTEDGYWMVFVEFKRQPNLWTKLFSMVKDIENLTEKQNWKVQAYHQEQLFGLKDAELRQAVPTTEEDYLSTRGDTELAEYFEDSALQDFEQEQQYLTFESCQGQLGFDLVDFGTESKVTKRQKLDERVFDFRTTNPRALALKNMLGEGWSVYLLEGLVIVEKEDHPKIVVLK